MRYDFRCEKCEGVLEHVQPITAKLPTKLKCKRQGCGGWCFQVVTAAFVSKAGMSHEPFDIAVGRDAEARWADIHRRQAIRNKVRKESGEQALIMTGRNEFAPMKGKKLGKFTIGPDAPKSSGPESAATKNIVEALKKKD